MKSSISIRLEHPSVPCSACPDDKTLLGRRESPLVSFLEDHKETYSTYSSTIGCNQASSLAIAAYSSLYAVCIARPCLKQFSGNKLGKSVTGAVVARELDGS